MKPAVCRPVRPIGRRSPGETDSSIPPPFLYRCTLYLVNDSLCVLLCFCRSIMHAPLSLSSVNA